MHPAPSVIIFTSLSGLGLGLFAWLGLGVPNVHGWVSFAFFFVAYALSVGGILASVFHLANKKSVIYSFSQWRTSWLSREGVLAVITLLTFAPYAIGRIFFDTNLAIFGYAGSVLALITVFVTSMIYTQLKSVPRWNMPLTPVLFLLYAVSGGALIAGEVRIAGFLIAILTLVQIAAWAIGDGRFTGSGTDKGTATGLGSLGKVRVFESAHTSRNYIMDEMVHVVGRKHSMKIRTISALTIGLVPAVMLLLLPVGHVTALIALVIHLFGVFASRWLFFAEAEHVVGLYYSRG